ncbi:MAG: GNAT family N-acetyltransferase, partial [Bacteroidota bacterium]
TNSKFRGRNLLSNLIEWVRTFADSQQKKFVRLDTVGNNHGLIKLYQNAGFTFLGMKKLSSTKGLPEHYNHGDVCYFQIAL